MSALRLKLTALALSTGLAGLAGGLFAYYHVSYYPSHPFSPHWTFDALLMTFIGGVGTLHGPVLGAVLYVVLKEYLALRWVDFHLLIFGALFIAIVLLLPGGLVQAAERVRRLVGRGRGSVGTGVWVTGQLARVVERVPRPPRSTGREAPCRRSAYRPQDRSRWLSTATVAAPPGPVPPCETLNSQNGSPYNPRTDRRRPR